MLLSTLYCPPPSLSCFNLVREYEPHLSSPSSSIFIHPFPLQALARCLPLLLHFHSSLPPPSPSSVPPPPPPFLFIPSPPPSPSSVPPPPPFSFIPPPSKPQLGASASSLLSPTSLLSHHKQWYSLEQTPPGFVKLNTDASYKYNCQRSSIAGVCRDEDGIWMFGFSSRIQSGSSFEAELVAVREAFKLAWDRGLTRVIVESDSESVVDRIRNQIIRQPKNHLEEIILECQGYVSRRCAWSCFIQHTYREGNFAADALTKKLVSESFELHVWNHPPQSLSLILLADLVGMEVPRHGALDKNQIGQLKLLKRELLARNLHWYWSHPLSDNRKKRTGSGFQPSFLGRFEN